MSAFIAIEGGFDGSNGHGLSQASFMPIGGLRKDFNVFRPKMMVSVGRMLHDGRLVGTRCGLSGGKVLSVSRCG